MARDLKARYTVIYSGAKDGFMACPKALAQDERNNLGQQLNSAPRFDFLNRKQLRWPSIIVALPVASGLRLSICCASIGNQMLHQQNETITNHFPLF